MASVRDLVRRFASEDGLSPGLRERLARIEANLSQMHAPLLNAERVDRLRQKPLFARLPQLLHCWLRLRDFLRIDQSRQHRLTLEALHDISQALAALDRSIGDLQATIAKPVPFGRQSGVAPEPAVKPAGDGAEQLQRQLALWRMRLWWQGRAQDPSWQALEAEAAGQMRAFLSQTGSHDCDILVGDPGAPEAFKDLLARKDLRLSMVGEDAASYSQWRDMGVPGEQRALAQHLSLLAPASLDAMVLLRSLDHRPPEEVCALLLQCARVLRRPGLLILACSGDATLSIEDLAGFAGLAGLAAPRLSRPGASHALLLAQHEAAAL